MRVYYQETTGPENYRNPDELNVNSPAPNTPTSTVLDLASNYYDYPLVTVEIGEQGNQHYC